MGFLSAVIAIAIGMTGPWISTHLYSWIIQFPIFNYTLLIGTPTLALVLLVVVSIILRKKQLIPSIGFYLLGIFLGIAAFWGVAAIVLILMWG